MSEVGMGRIQVYTGDGKGKTTAALGLALRAAGAGLRVHIIQFLKGRRCSEHRALERFADLVTVSQFGREGFVEAQPSDEDKEQGREAFALARKALLGGEYDVVVLDEVCVAINHNLLSTKELIGALKARHEGVEAVVTGRNAPAEIIRVADLVTEMRAVKHYFQRGAKARQGIEY
jgi:cob(I)alamin adenosyltransferase